MNDLPARASEKSGLELDCRGIRGLDVAHALLRAVSTIVSIPLRGQSVTAARMRRDESRRGTR